VEINSSFYRPHQKKTYTRWAESVPPTFRFSVKVPKEITHTLRLRDAQAAVDRFTDDASGLGTRLGIWLVQLPPSLRFEREVAVNFFEYLGSAVATLGGVVVCEPRHASWFTPQADSAMVACNASRAAADPACCSAASNPGGSPSTAYYRWHGSPQLYYSAYAPNQIDWLSGELSSHVGQSRNAWCIFDNTAAGAATENGLQLMDAMQES